MVLFAVSLLSSCLCCRESKALLPPAPHPLLPSLPAVPLCKRVEPLTPEACWQWTPLVVTSPRESEGTRPLSHGPWVSAGPRVVPTRPLEDQGASVAPRASELSLSLHRPQHTWLPSALATGPAASQFPQGFCVSWAPGAWGIHLGQSSHHHCWACWLGLG